MRLVRQVAIALVGGLCATSHTFANEGRRLMPIDVNAAILSGGSVVGRVPASAAVSSNVVCGHRDGDDKITVTTYHNNGLWQRIKRWWKQAVQREDSFPTDGSRHRESRRGSTGTSLSISDNNEGGGTLTFKAAHNCRLLRHLQHEWERYLETLQPQQAEAKADRSLRLGP
ncbi:unnamed protein product [Hyaloperonospora brassicae]|uniref:RxLR effector candidate protein n=1 Tax=Hyaloperonospora brassicae TaxID=162125 RepID=A0AAV0UUS9_HYABA|nr:unnamed protein product [Hyaloperonospora brassicae]